MAVSLEEVEGMLEDGRSPLDAIVHPRRPIFFLVDGYGCGLTADYGHALDDGDFVFVWVLGEGGGTGL